MLLDRLLFLGVMTRTIEHLIDSRVPPAVDEIDTQETERSLREVGKEIMGMTAHSIVHRQASSLSLMPPAEMHMHAFAALINSIVKLSANIYHVKR